MSEVDFESQVSSGDEAAGAERLVPVGEAIRYRKRAQNSESRVAQLEEQFNNISRDLEKAVQFHAALGWLEPALNRISERLEALEHTQNTISDRMLQLVERIYEMQENTTLVEVIKRVAP